MSQVNASAVAGTVALTQTCVISGSVCVETAPHAVATRLCAMQARANAVTAQHAWERQTRVTQQRGNASAGPRSRAVGRRTRAVGACAAGAGVGPHAATRTPACQGSVFLRTRAKAWSARAVRTPAWRGRAPCVVLRHPVPVILTPVCQVNAACAELMQPARAPLTRVLGACACAVRTLPARAVRTSVSLASARVRETHVRA